MSEQPIRHTHLTPEELDSLAESPATLPVARRDHARSCAHCAREVAGMRRLSEAFERLPAHSPAPGFTERVMARVTLPLPWHRRAAVALRERKSAALGAAAAIAALVAGAGLWATRFPDLRPLTLAGWLAGEAGDLLWQGTIVAARAVYATGLADLGGALHADLSLASAFWAVATVCLVGVGSLSVMVRLVRTEPEPAHIP